MYWPINNPWFVIAKYTAIVVIGSVIGWSVNGWRLNSKIHQIEAKHAKEIADAERHNREIEARLQSEADRLRRNKDHQIRLLNGRVAGLLDSLRNRPERGSTTTNSTCSCFGVSGKELARRDAAFLAGYAADAERLQLALNQCKSQYEALRNP